MAYTHTFHHTSPILSLIYWKAQCMNALHTMHHHYLLFIITYVCIHRPGIPPPLYVNTELYIDMAHTGLCACIQVTSAAECLPTQLSSLCMCVGMHYTLAHSVCMSKLNCRMCIYNLKNGSRQDFPISIIIQHHLLHRSNLLYNTHSH